MCVCYRLLCVLCLSVRDHLVADGMGVKCSKGNSLVKCSQVFCVVKCSEVRCSVKCSDMYCSEMQ